MDALDDDDDDDDHYSDVLDDERFMFWSSHEEVLEAIMIFQWDHEVLDACDDAFLMMMAFIHTPTHVAHMRFVVLYVAYIMISLSFSLFW
jgi:hypothetical protein